VAGHQATALANQIQELQVETFVLMEQWEKMDFIWEQMRLLFIQ
jgi:hypothetical protein